MDQFISQLAQKLGILTSFFDGGLTQKEYSVNENTIKFFSKQLGYKAGNIQDIAKSLDDLDKKRWQKTLEAIYISSAQELKFDAVVTEQDKDSDFSVSLKSQQTNKSFDVSVTTKQTELSRQIGKTTYVQLEFTINQPLEIGYYDLSLKFGSKKIKSVLAVAPEKCYENPVLQEGRLWGYALQLYALRSERNWGIGDFTDLQTFIKICSNSDASIIGLNPLNVLLHNYPEEASPYQSISRLFLNPIYIDIEAVPEFIKEDKKGFESKLKKLRDSEYIDYTGVYTLKAESLQKLYERFKTKASKERKKAFEDFCQEHDEDLNKLAIFQTLYDQKGEDHWGGWRAWEEGFKNPNTVTIKNFAKENEDKINFFKYLQFEADRQFALCGELINKSGMKIGLYRDLAVGVGNDSCEVWSNQGIFIKDAGAGAPPDAFFPGGQNWDLGAFNPFELKDLAYTPFIKILRANMKYAGGLRIDHVMSLMRLYIIPNDTNISGTYIMYNFEDMLNLVAIESHLNKCIIVGESIGNVPAGFLERISEKNIHNISVIWAERWENGWGNFRFPHEYPIHSFVSVGTHDMAPLRAWWFGRDILEMRNVGIINNDEDMNKAYHQRELDRWKLLSAMDSNSVWPRDNMRSNNFIYGEGFPEGLEEAVNSFMAKTSSRVFLAELENIFHLEKLQNLPGTNRDKHPNWRLKLPVSLESFETDRAYIRNLAAIKEGR